MMKSFRSISVLFATSTILCNSALALNATFYPKNNLTDTSGNAVQAHGGAIVKSSNDSESSWYWFGEDKGGEESSNRFRGVNCYKSADLTHWESLGHVLSPINGTAISADDVVERRKVLFNDENEEYVMWFHSDNGTYGTAMVGVATSKTIGGQNSWKGSFQPHGNESRDMTVWRDEDDGSAYLIFATNNNRDLQISNLTDNYQNVSDHLYTFSGVFWEAPGVFKINGTFYLLYSRQDGWTPTDNYFMTAKSMSGPWSEPTLLAPPLSYAFLTQNTYDITIQGSEADFYLYYGDHWNADALGSSQYAFYPVTLSGSELVLENPGAWTLDLESGKWSEVEFSRITAVDASNDNQTLVACEDGCQGGKAVNMTGNSTFAFTWEGTAGKKLVGIEYTYTGPKNSFRHIGATVNGSAVDGNALLETSRVNNVTQEAPFPMTLQASSKVELSLLDYDGQDLLIDGVKVYEYMD